MLISIPPPLHPKYDMTQSSDTFHTWYKHFEMSIFYIEFKDAVVDCVLLDTYAAPSNIGVCAAWNNQNAMNIV